MATMMDNSVCQPYMNGCNWHGVESNTELYGMQYKVPNTSVVIITISHMALLSQWQKVNQILESQQTPHISSSRASYWVSVVRILEKMAALKRHCTVCPLFIVCWLYHSALLLQVGKPPSNKETKGSPELPQTVFNDYNMVYIWCNMTHMTV